MNSYTRIVLAFVCFMVYIGRCVYAFWKGFSRNRHERKVEWIEVSACLVIAAVVAISTFSYVSVDS